MEKLTARTVFHEILMHEKSEEEDHDEEQLENYIITTSSPEPQERESTQPALPNIDSDEEWDTDLESEDHGRQREYTEYQARQVYLAACRQLNIVPANCFLKAVNGEVMNLNFQGLGPSGTRAVATGLVMDRFTKYLYLAGNFVGQDGIRNVCEMLKENDNIIHLDLSENDLDTYAAQVITGVFKDNDTLSHLNLSGNNFKDFDAEYFAELLNVGLFTALRTLDLSHNILGDIGGGIMGHAIGDNETLTHIDLSWNQIRGAGISCISKGLAENNTLRVLNLASNGVDNQGAEDLGVALTKNRKLTELNLNSNRVGFAGITSLFKSIAKNDTLEIIRLTNNPITSHGPVVALNLLQQCDTSVLRELEIADACVPREFYDLLQQLQKNRPQFKVHLGGFMNARDMCKVEIKSQTEAWKKDPVLVFINFIEERKMKLFDMFKILDKDKSCALSTVEFHTGLTKMGCPLKDKELKLLLNVFDVDKNGEIDIGEFLDGFDKHKRRLTKYSENAAKSRVSSATPKATTKLPSPRSSRPSSSSSSSFVSLANSRPTSGINARGISTEHLAKALAAETKTFLEPPVQEYALQAPFNQTLDKTDIVPALPKSLTVT